MKVEIKTLETHTDERGILYEIIKDSEIDESVMQVYFSKSNPGAVRGNHYHKRKVEWFMIPYGKTRLFLKDNETGEEQKLILSEDKPTIVKMYPGVSHAIQNIGNGESMLIAITNEVFNPEDPDTYPVKLI